MAKFRGLHVVAGIAAMLVAAMLGSALKLNNTSIVMSSCVVFVAVAMWVDSALTRRRREALTLQQAASLKQATSLEPGRETGGVMHQDISRRPASEPGESSDAQSKHEGNAA